MRRTAILLILLLAACSSSTKATTAPTTTTTSGPSVKQVAASVAQARAQYGQAMAEYTGNGYPCATAVLTAVNNVAFASLRTPEDNSANVIECQDAAGKTAVAADAIGTALGVPVPAELASLAKQTKAGAKTVAREADELGSCMSNTDIQNCFPDTLTSDAKALQATLAGWDAYL